MQPTTLWDQILGHMSIQSKFQLSRAYKSKMVTWKPFSIVAAPQFTERLKQLCVTLEPVMPAGQLWILPPALLLQVFETNYILDYLKYEVGEPKANNLFL